MPYDLQKLRASGFRELLEELLGDDFDSEVLQQVLPWPHDLPPLNRTGGRCGRSTPLSRHLRLHEVMASHAACAGVLAQLPFRRGFMGFLKLAAEGRELDALEELLVFGVGVVDTAPSRCVNAICLLLVRCMLGLDGRKPENRDFARCCSICMRAQNMIVGAGVNIEALPLFLFKGLGFARCSKDPELIALSELLVGTVNVSNTPLHNNAVFHAVMARGAFYVEHSNSTALLMKAVPYLGLYYLIEGNFRQAATFLLIAVQQEEKNGHRMLEMFYGRQWSHAVSCRGDFDYAGGILQAKLRRRTLRSDSQLVRSLRGQLAALYLRTGQLDKAIDQLDSAKEGISPQSDIVSWVANSRHQAHYHILCGNLPAAYSVLQSALSEAERQGYVRPVYLGNALLEILMEFETAGFPPVPCYDLSDELQRCIRGPNRLLQGVARRLEGKRILLAGGDEEQAAKSFAESAEVLSKIGAALELAKTRLMQASLCRARGDREQALSFALKAWPLYPQLRNFYWPAEILELIPAELREERGASPSPDYMMEEYKKSLASLSEIRDSAGFFRMLLNESARLWEAGESWLFRRAWRDAGLELVAVQRKDQREGREKVEELKELANFVMEGVPLIMEGWQLSSFSGQSGDILFGIPVDCRPSGMYALVHYGSMPARRELIEEDFLERLGRMLAWEVQHSGLPESGREKEVGGCELICASPRMEDLLSRVDLAAPTEASVLLVGESGAGKELIARRIHEKSGRRGKLVTVNAASLGDELLESELFGHEKGAFTGAYTSKVGLMEQAHEGTLFLDEITEASPRVQAKLLRAIQERHFYRVGGVTPVRADFRLITASNRDVVRAVADGRFRRDLFFRIGVICLRIPPLRERPEDILSLAGYYLHFFARLHGRVCVPEFSPEVQEKLRRYAWPGNVRELRNVVEQSVVLSGGKTVTFPAEELTFSGEQDRSFDVSFVEGKDWPSLEELEKDYLNRALEHCRWRIDGRGGVLELLGLKRSTLYDKLRRHGLKKPS